MIAASISISGLVRVYVERRCWVGRLRLKLKYVKGSRLRLDGRDEPSLHHAWFTK